MSCSVYLVEYTLNHFSCSLSLSLSLVLSPPPPFIVFPLSLSFSNLSPVYISFFLPLHLSPSPTLSASLPSFSISLDLYGEHRHHYQLAIFQHLRHTRMLLIVVPLFLNDLSNYSRSNQSHFFTLISDQSLQ